MRLKRKLRTPEMSSMMKREMTTAEKFRAEAIKKETQALACLGHSAIEVREKPPRNFFGVGQVKADEIISYTVLVKSLKRRSQPRSRAFNRWPSSGGR